LGRELSRHEKRVFSIPTNRQLLFEEI